MAPEEEREHAKPKELSGRERQILGLAAAGLADKQIAAELDITTNTLSTYWNRIRDKSGNVPRAGLTAAFVKDELTKTWTLPSAELADVLADTDDAETLRRTAIYYATALHRLQEALRKASRACRVVAAYPRPAIDARTEDELITATCRLIVEEGGYVMAWVGLPRSDEARSVGVAGSYGDTGDYLGNIEISWGDNALGAGPTGTALRTGETRVNQDVEVNPAMGPWRSEAIAHGFHSSIALPLRADTNTFGVLTIYAPEPDSFDNTESILLGEFANCFARVWSRMRKDAKG